MSKIVFILTQSLDSPSGLGRYSPLAQELSKLGHGVDIVALHPDFDNLEKKKLNIGGVNVHYVAQMHVRKFGNTKSYYSNIELLVIAIKATWNLCRYTINAKPDIVVVGKPHPMNSIAGLTSKFLKRSVLYLDCDDYETGSGRFNSRWQKSIVAFFEKWMPHHVNVITTNTHFMQEKLKGWGIPTKNIIYIPNGIEQNRFFEANKVEANLLRMSLNLDNNKVIAFIGSLSLPSHPINLLFEAFFDIRKSNDKSVLLLVGGGEDIPNLKRLADDLGISDATRFCGRVPPEKIPLYYTLADVSVDPVYDNDAARGRSPLKLFESWACGVPFISADVGDRKFLLGDPPAGLLAEPGDSVSLAEKILEVLSNPDLSSCLRTRGLARVKDYYWEVLANRYNEVFYDFQQTRKFYDQ